MDNDKCIISILIISSDSINNISLYLNPEKNSSQNIHFYRGIYNNLIMAYYMTCECVTILQATEK